MTHKYLNGNEIEQIGRRGHIPCIIGHSEQRLQVHCIGDHAHCGGDQITLAELMHRGRLSLHIGRILEPTEVDVTAAGARSGHGRAHADALHPRGGQLDERVLELLRRQHDQAERDGQGDFPQARADVDLGAHRLQVTLVRRQWHVDAAEFDVAIDVVLPPNDRRAYESERRFP